MKFISLDTETTGFGKKDRVLEIGAVRFDPKTGACFEHIHQYINPEMDVPAEVSAIHGLTNDFLQDKPTFSQVWPELRDFLGDDSVVVAHNAPFDVRMLDGELIRLGEPRLFSEIAEQVQDTLAISRRLPFLGGNSLDVLCRRYGVSLANRELHGALIDCELLAQVYPSLMAEFESLSSQVRAIVGRGLAEPVPQESLEDKVHHYLRLKALVSSLEKDLQAYGEVIRSETGAKTCEGEDWRVRFEEGSTTNWRQVTAAHLAGIDLSSFKTKTTKMYIEALKA